MRMSAMAPLKGADRVPAQTGALGQFFLRDPGRLAQASQMLSE